MIQASSYAGVVDDAFIFILGTSIVLLIGVTLTMLFFAFRYSRARNPVAAQIEGNMVLETIWTVIPTGLVLMMFWYGWTGFRIMRDVPEGAMEIEAIGRMWSWAFRYPDGHTSDELVVPLHQPVRLTLTSEDVIHSFYVPAFRIKEDVMPVARPENRNHLWFQAEKTGEFNVLCAEYCGERHSKMLSKVRVLPQEEYDNWLAAAAVTQVDILKLKGCTACHSLDGSRIVGPSFRGIFGSTETVVSGGTEHQVVVDAEYVRKSLAEPLADVVKGYPPAMPPQQLTDDEIAAVIARLQELR